MRQRKPRIGAVRADVWQSPSADGAPARPRLRSNTSLIRPAAAFVALLAMLLGPAAGVQAQAVVPSADLRLSASVEEGPPGGGVTTGSEMRYQITIENRGPDPIPADGIALVIFVDRSDSTDAATIEVSRFGSGTLKNLPGGACGVGRHQILRCTNRQEIAPNQAVSVQVGHRHPAALTGQLSFFAEVTPRNVAFIDPGEGNNSFRGPSYSFRNPPTTTTTTAMTTTTTEPTTTTTDPNSTSTSDSTSSSTSTSSSSTTSSTTTTTAPTTTTTAPTTTTTAPTTTIEVSTSSLELMAGTDATLVPPSSNVASVLESTGSAEELDPDAAVALGPRGEDDGGPPYLLIAGFLAVLVLVGGVGLATYSYYNRDPPLVDIRQYH